MSSRSRHPDTDLRDRRGHRRGRRPHRNLMVPAHARDLGVSADLASPSSRPRVTKSCWARSRLQSEPVSCTQSAGLGSQLQRVRGRSI
jgi:hypothetical protein